MLNRLLGRRRRHRRTGPWQAFRHFRRLLPFLRPHRKLAVGSVSIVVASALAELAAPWPLALVIDTVIGDKPLPSVLEPLVGGLGTYGLLAILVIGGLLVTALAYGLGVIDNYVHTKLNLRLVLDLRSALYQHIQRLSLAFHDHVPTGQIMFRLTQQTSSIGLIVVALPPLAQSLLTVVGMFVIAVFVDWQLALISLVVLPLIVGSARYYARQIEPRVYEVQTLEGRSQSIMYEAVAMIRVILAFGRERNQYERWRSQAQLANDARVRLTLRQTLFSLAVAMITAGGTALIIGVGAANVLQGRLTVGELIVLLGYISAIYKPLQHATATFGSLQQQLINFEAALEVLDIDECIKDAPDAVEVGTAKGRIVFDKVHFEYGQPTEVAGSSLLPAGLSPSARQYLEDPDIVALCRKARELGLKVESIFARGHVALTDMSFEVQPGQHVAIVGPTGAGKTTLVNLLMRFYDPQRGAVLLDGVDLRRLKVASLREQISVVLQEPMLFADTIGENIRYGRSDATDAEVVAAAKAANVHEFISHLPDEYESIIGERGSQLSGGERQRISVARAFLKDAPILLLDEPTSSIDSRTESVVLGALERLMEGRTTFTVAHRLSTIRGANLILVLDHGRLVQQGSHEELLAEGGLYKQLHDLQLGLAPLDGFQASDGRGDQLVRAVPPMFLLVCNLVAPALVTLLENGSAGQLRALFERLPRRLRLPACWLLIGSVLAVLRDDSDVPLRRLAARVSDPRPDMVAIAHGAANLLERRHVLHSIWQDLQRAPGNRPQQPLDTDAILREPWTEIALAHPEAKKMLTRVLPTGRPDAFVDAYMPTAVPAAGKT
jgi:ATP-binding cassette subfamily B protein